MSSLKAAILTVTFVTGKDTNENQPKEEAQRVDSEMGPNSELPGVLSLWSHGQCHLLPAMTCDICTAYCQPGKLI